MSYEQPSGLRSDELDARSDIYSLGVVVYEMLTGRTPFPSDTSLGYWRKHTPEEPPPFRAVKPGLPAPPRIESLVMKALNQDRNQRYNSVWEFALEFAQAARAGSHLTAQLEPQGETAKPQPQTIDTAAPKARHHIWRNLVLGLAGLCALGVLGRGGSYAWTRYVTWREVWKQTRPCREWERKHPIGSPLDFINLQEQRGGSFIKGVSGGTQIVLAPPGCSGPLEEAYSKRESMWREEQRKAAATAHQPPKAASRQPPNPASPPHTNVPLAGPTATPTTITMNAAKVEAPLANLTPAPGEAKVNPKDGLVYVWIPPRTFMMGCSPGDNECKDDEKPPHPVTITRGFWLGQTEVTVGAYKRFAAATGKAMPPDSGINRGWSNEQMPIVNITWNDAHDYCAWAGGRLPTEAEWEYAARAGNTGARYGSIDEVAWHADNSGLKTHQVGQKRANGFGLYDMLGNVWEWVNDWSGENYYKNSPPHDPAGPAIGQERILRGGSWLSSPRFVRVSDRLRYNPIDRLNNFGFRCVGEVIAP